MWCVIWSCDINIIFKETRGLKRFGQKERKFVIAASEK